ncbi:MAG: TetR/AcrR family transcriptional regulator [Pseudomonadales bacterium]|nr:TetR/AcrR family transcriptional regulator [Pseudomonadales bacterium]
MGVAERRSREKQLRIKAIIDAAESVFFCKGFAGSSMDEIAGKAQLSRTLLYVYFKDKAAIMRGVMLRAAQALEQRFERALHAGKTGLEQIEGIGKSYYAFSQEQSDYFDLLTDLNTFPLPPEESQESQALSCCRTRITDIMVQALQNGIQDGSLSPQRVRIPLRTAYFLQGALHGVIMATRQSQAGDQVYPDSEDLVLYTIAMLSESMRSFPGDPRQEIPAAT